MTMHTTTISPHHDGQFSFQEDGPMMTHKNTAAPLPQGRRAQQPPSTADRSMRGVRLFATDTAKVVLAITVAVGIGYAVYAMTHREDYAGIATATVAVLLSCTVIALPAWQRWTQINRSATAAIPYQMEWRRLKTEPYTPHFKRKPYTVPTRWRSENIQFQYDRSADIFYSHTLPIVPARGIYVGPKPDVILLVTAEAEIVGMQIEAFRSVWLKGHPEAAKLGFATHRFYPYLAHIVWGNVRQVVASAVATETSHLNIQRAH